MQSDKTLILLTGNFPYLSGEEFIETEIYYTSSYFKKVIIIPNGVSSEKREIPNNCVLLNFSKFIPNDLPFRNTPKNIWHVVILFKILSKEFRPYSPYLLNKRHLISYCKEVVRKKDCFLKFLKDNNLLISNIVVYSYWNNDQVTFFSLFKKIGLDFNLIARAHEADLYEEHNNKNGFFLFRKFNIQGLNKFVLISKQGKNYISNKYPEYKSKYELSYLGTKGLEQNKNLASNEIKQVLSCSYINSRKRIHLIIEILRNCKSKIHWTHLGGGDNDLTIELINMANSKLPSNVTFEFKGHQSNSEVLNYYQNNWVDCFILVSENEGLPVSLMEVASFGIPMMATNVGGVSEIVNAKTGILIDKDFDISDAVFSLENLLYNGESVIKREDVRKHWEMNFNAEMNYNQFAQSLLSL